MTLNDFRNWVESSYSVHISIRTAQAWLPNLGFDQKSHYNSVYFDGHERDDVTEYRKEFVDRMFELENACTQGILHNYNQERSQ